MTGLKISRNVIQSGRKALLDDSTVEFTLGTRAVTKEAQTVTSFDLAILQE